MVILQELKSEKGATLAYLMVVMAILIMLGIAVMTTTFAAYMLKISESHDQTAMYVSEAGLNEAYAYLGEEIENAAQYSRKVYIPAQLINHPEVGLKSPDEASYKTAIDEYFKRGYKSYFLMNEAVIKNRLEEKLLIRPASKYGKNGEKISTITANILNNFSESVDNLKIEFKTTVIKTDHLGQAIPKTSEIRAVMTIGVPAYETPIEKQAKVIKKNALLDQAVAADGNLYISGGKVTIDGNGTILGHDGANGVQLSSNAGGIVVGGVPVRWDANRNPNGTVSGLSSLEGNFEVTGNLVTGKFLRIAESTKLKPSQVHIGGNFHGNSMAIQGEANEKGSIQIDGFASVYDDMELESPNSTIRIGGSYYGFSSGISGGMSTSVHDNSSSIVINNPSFGLSGDESEITISGTSGVVFPENAATGVAPTPPETGTYLAGTIYADEGKTFILKTGEGPTHGTVTVLSNGTYQYMRAGSVGSTVTDSFKVDIYYEDTFIETKDVSVNLSDTETKRFGYVQNSYQTGDSVSVHGNYVAYSKILSGSNPINLGDDPVDPSYLDLDELIHFESFEPLFLVNRKKDLSNPDQTISMNYTDKEKYSFYSQRQDNTNLNLGSGRINLGTVIYSTGTVLNTSGMEHSKGDLSSESLVLAYLSKEYDYYVKNFGDPQHKDYIGEEGSLIAGGIGSWLRTGSPDIKSDSNNELFYIQPDTNRKTVILKGAGDDALDELLASVKTQIGADQYVVMDCTNPVKGMIVSNSDIYVLEKLIMKVYSLPRKAFTVLAMVKRYLRIQRPVPQRTI